MVTDTLDFSMPLVPNTEEFITTLTANAVQLEKEFGEDRAELKKLPTPPVMLLWDSIPIFLEGETYIGRRTNVKFYQWRDVIGQSFAGYLAEVTVAVIESVVPDFAAYLKSEAATYEREIYGAVWRLFNTQQYHLKAQNEEGAEITAVFEGVQSWQFLIESVWLGFSQYWFQIVKHQHKKYLYERVKSMEDGEARRVLYEIDSKMRALKYLHPGAGSIDFSSIDAFSALIKTDLAEKEEMEKKCLLPPPTNLSEQNAAARIENTTKPPPPITPPSKLIDISEDFVQVLYEAIKGDFEPTDRASLLKALTGEPIESRILCKATQADFAHLFARMIKNRKCWSSKAKIGRWMAGAFYRIDANNQPEPFRERTVTDALSAPHTGRVIVWPDIEGLSR